MKHTRQPHTHKITFNEVTQAGKPVLKSFTTPKELLSWHLQQMKKSKEVIRDICVSRV